MVTINFIFIYSIIFINSIINKMLYLGKLNIYDENNFIRYNYVERTFNDFVSNNCVQNAIVLTVKLQENKFIAAKEGNRKFSELNKQTNGVIHGMFSKHDSLFVKSSDGNACVILWSSEPYSNSLQVEYNGNNLLNRVDNDSLKHIEEIVSLFPKKIITDKNEYSINPQAFCSIYGVHTNNILEILDNLDLILKKYIYDPTKNKVLLFDQSVNELSLRDRTLLSNLKQKIDVLDIVVSLEKISLPYHETFCIPSFFYQTKMIIGFDKIIGLLDGENKNTLLRNLASRTISLYGNIKDEAYPLLVYYSYNLLCSETMLINKIKSLCGTYGVDVKNINLFVNLKDNAIISDTFINTYNYAKKEQIDFIFYNVSTNNIDFLKSTKPKFILFHESVYENKDIYDNFLCLCSKLGIKVIKK